MITSLLVFALILLPETGPARPPAWARRALERTTTPIVHRLATPANVAGVRGAEARPEELYWKTRHESAEKLLGEAERAENEARLEAARRLYGRALASGAADRLALRARIGLARCDLLDGRADDAIRRLRMILSSSTDPDARYAAALPAAIGLATAGRRDEAISLLKETLLAAPDHPLAGQADALLWVISEESGR